MIRFGCLDVTFVNTSDLNLVTEQSSPTDKVFLVLRIRYSDAVFYWFIEPSFIFYSAISNGKVVPALNIKAHRGNRGTAPLILTSALAAVAPGKNLGTHKIRDWVGSRVGMDDFVEDNPSCSWLNSKPRPSIRSH